jgi:two-component system nitrogen regulation sensor histidine kinase GlnL
MKPRRSPRRPAVRAVHRPPPLPWEDVLVHFTDAVVVLDAAGRIALFNQAAEELLHVPQARVLGQPATGVFAESAAVLDTIRRVRESGQDESRGDEELCWRGGRLPVRIRCWPIWGPRDRIRGITLVLHDLRYQRQLEEAARRHETLARLGTLVAALAHEIKNPLAGIKGATQLLAGRLGEQPALREYTSVIGREVNRLSTLLEDLLTFGAPPQPRLRRLNVHQVIQHVLSVMDAELGRRGFRVICEFDPSLPDVAGDDAQLSQVLLNLLKNAMDAMSVEGALRLGRDTIAIRTRMETDFHILRAAAGASKFLRIEVADQGVGLDPDAAARIFEPFFSTKPHGTGLGLAISQRIATEHGGSIRAAANRPHGTVMTLTLPVAHD